MTPGYDAGVTLLGDRGEDCLDILILRPTS